MTGPDLTPEQRETLAKGIFASMLASLDHDDMNPQQEARFLAAGLAPVVARMLADADRQGAARVRENYRADGYVDEAGMPMHLPMGLTAAGEGPTEPDPPHHRGCWCPDPECMWTKALAAERAEGAARVAAAVEALVDEFESEVDWSNGRSNYGDNSAWESATRQLRAALADSQEGDQ